MNDNCVLIFLLKRFKKVVKFCADSFLSHVEIQFNLIKAQVILTTNIHMHNFSFWIIRFLNLCASIMIILYIDIIITEYGKGFNSNMINVWICKSFCILQHGYFSNIHCTRIRGRYTRHTCAYNIFSMFCCVLLLLFLLLTSTCCSLLL